MNILTFIQIAVTLFFAILFLQSGLDKVLDFKGNRGYIRSVFEKTFLKSISDLLFILITILEVGAGVYCLIGVVIYYLNGNSYYAVFGLHLSIISLISLFFGQRIAKDYAGAASLVGYFLLAVFGMYLFQ